MKLPEKSTILLNILLSSIICFLTVSVQAQQNKKVLVPDSNFQVQLKSRYHITFDGDNHITNPDVAAQLTGLHFFNTNFENVRGIEAFTSLRELTVDSWALTNIDLSSNKALKKLFITSSVLDSIDVSANTALTHLIINANLSSIDLSANRALTTLYLYGNQLTDLDLSTNKALDTLSCAHNQLISLDLTNNTRLIQLHCGNNQFANLNLSNLPYLKLLNCDANQLSVLNLSSNLALEHLSCSSNQLAALDLSYQKDLIFLNCSYNQIGTLYLSPNASLSHLECRNNQLSHFSFWDMKLDRINRNNSIYEGNQFPFYYNEIVPLEKNTILKLYQPTNISFFLIYHFILVVLLLKKDNDVKRNRIMNFWILIGNLVIMPVWYILFTESSDSLSLFYYLISFGVIGILIQLRPLVKKMMLFAK
ncbi:MAG: hypothetical protein ACJA08_001744 [Cyclobacteriaceae bacterium]|jgi:hypothetical protein